MAFSNTRRVDLGGGLFAVFGDFTQTLGGGSQTFAIAASRILICQINNQATGEPVDFNSDLYSISQSNAIATLTIYGNASVTAGTFFIIANTGG